MRYYKVIVRCGHVGIRRYIPQSLYIKAINGKEAAKIARRIGRVKHDHKFAILDVKIIGKDDYQEGLLANRNDPYFQATNIQEQRINCPNLYQLIQREEEPITYKKSRKRRNLIEAERKEEWQKEKKYYC